MDIGYACLSVMVKDASCARTVTVRRAQALPDDDARQELCRQVARANLTNTRRLVFHNAAHGLRLYRITPQLVPLATHELMAGWNWQEDLREDFRSVGEAMQIYGLRISSHPGQYTVLSSPHSRVLAAAVRDLTYHADLMELLGFGETGRTVLHVGGAQGGSTSRAPGIPRTPGPTRTTSTPGRSGTSCAWRRGTISISWWRPSRRMQPRCGWPGTWAWYCPG